MNCVEIGEKVRGFRRERIFRQSLEVFSLLKSSEEAFHLPIDILRIAKSASVLGDPHRPRLPCPDIGILKKMVVNGLVMGDAHAAGWERFIRALSSERCFELIERHLIAKARNVLQNSGALVAVRVRYGVV